MYGYVAKRILFTIFACWLALSIVFVVVTAAPNTDQWRASMQVAQAGGNASEAMEAYAERHNLNEPLHERYLNYMENMFTLNWGWSTMRNQPVTTAIGTAWPYSAQIMIPSIILAVVFGMFIGLYSAMRQHTWVDYAGSFTAFFGVSIPNFWFAIMSILVVSVWLRDLAQPYLLFGYPIVELIPPVYYHTSYPMFSLANLQQIVLPILIVSTATVATQMRYARAEGLEYMESQWVKAARAKGAGEWHIMIKHVFRVALIPLSTILIGDALAILWSGAFLVEYVFQIPGLGLLAFKAITGGANDTALIMGVILIPTFLALVGNLLQDLAYVWLDPRINYGDRT
ncbi:ABC transporter permease [Halospeciosus flavus]|uniref:ABC transporter permease n=1 Tax=Halospeciosus flavus TaxID=3032283 RepID=A0ABD5Z1D9_9EURY|nr:ABC transporter permease [Halospeciosus flavus]